jgi:hypothetical protein
MDLWWQIPVVLCAVALTVALVATVVALRQTLRRAERLLTAFEQEVAPTLVALRGLTEEAKAATREARMTAVRLSTMIERAHQVSEGLGTLVMGLWGLTRAGQIMGIAAAIRKGIDVFVQRLATPTGGNHG